MKVLQINSCLNKSTGRIAQQIGDKAIEDGFNSFIAYPARAGICDSKSHLIEIGSSVDAKVHAVITRVFDRHGLASAVSTKNFVKRILDINPDIIHLHNIHGYYINYPILFKYLSTTDIPIVWTFHDCWPMTGHCVHYTDVKCSKWKGEGCSNCPKKKSYPASLLSDRSSQNFKDKKKYFTSLKNLTIVPVSYWLGSVVEQSFFKGTPIKVIQNGIDLKTFYPRTNQVEIIREKYGWKDKFVILGVATGWSEEVGYSTFMKLRSSLGPEFAIAMVGLTEKQKKSLPGGITGILHTDRIDELAEIYTAADVLFNGSFQETFGLVTAEAIACGTPAVVYDSTACPEIVTERTGRIVPLDDDDKVISAILSIYGLTPYERKEMSAACVEYATQNFDKEKRYEEYVELYKRLMNN